MSVNCPKYGKLLYGTHCTKCDCPNNPQENRKLPDSVERFLLEAERGKPSPPPQTEDGK